MILYKNGHRQITTNLNEHELFTKAPGVTQHELSDKTINGVQIVRDYYNVPVYIDSTYRPAWYNALIPGASSTSQHIKMKAIDFTFRNSEIQKAYNKEILNKGPLYKKLYAAGIRGFGVYDSFAHIDSRSSFAFWDNRQKKNFISNNGDDGLQLSLRAKILFSLVILLIIITSITIWKEHI